MKRTQIENIEIGLLLEAIFQRYGHDFRSYDRSHIARRLRSFLPKSGCKSVSELISRVLLDESFFEHLLLEVSITVSEMFRDPSVFVSLRERVIPLLFTYPFIKVWIAGCATGEEAYSVAIVLKEEHLYDRATIYATDFNDTALGRAKSGIFPMENVKKFTHNYQKAGGTHPFSQYYHADHGSVIMKHSLKENIVFANHNLVTDGVFSEMHLIVCRNVLIYFTRELQNRVLTLFADSLAHGGFVCLGGSEHLKFSSLRGHFKTVDEKSRIFQRTAL